MEKKINIAELLKDCPQGMELDCAMWDNITLKSVDINSNYPIAIAHQASEDTYTYNLTEYGCWNLIPNAKCVIYPKGKTTWEGFVPPCEFKDGDIVSTINGYFIGIFKYMDDTMGDFAYCATNKIGSLSTNAFLYFDRLATEEEKQKLFQAIKDNGYKWNAETKTLEKIEPKFKVGDRIKNKNSGICDKVIKIFEDCYLVESCLDEQATIGFDIQDNWVLVPNKFDITTLKPFDKVLTRTTNGDVWGADLFGWYKDGWFLCNGHIGFRQCIPYKENEHLLGTTNDCDEFYKTW